MHPCIGHPRILGLVFHQAGVWKAPLPVAEPVAPPQRHDDAPLRAEMAGRLGAGQGGLCRCNPLDDKARRG